MKSSFDFLRSKFTKDSALEMSWVISGHFTSVIISFVIIKFLSGMGTEEYGIYVLVLTAAAFIGIVYGPLQQTFIRFYYDYLNQNLVTQYLNIVTKYLFSVSGIFFVCVMIFSFLFGDETGYDLPGYFSLLAGFYIIILKINEFYNSGLNVIRRRKENAIFQGLEKLAVLIFLLAFYYSGDLNLINVFLSLNIIAVTALIIKIFVFKKFAGKSDRKPDGNEKKIKTTLLAYTTPFLIWAVAGWLQLNGEKWIINGILSTSDVGIYALMMNIVTALLALPNTVLGEFITPIIFKNYSDLSNTENVKSGSYYIKLTILIVAGLTVFSTLITYLIGEELIILLSSKSYTAHWYLLPLLCFGTGLFLIGQAQTLLGMALNKPQKYVFVKVATGILSVFINFLLIKNYGIDGVAYTLIMIGVFYSAYTFFINRSLAKYT